MKKDNDVQNYDDDEFLIVNTMEIWMKNVFMSYMKKIKVHNVFAQGWERFIGNAEGVLQFKNTPVQMYAVEGTK